MYGLSTAQIELAQKCMGKQFCQTVPMHFSFYSRRIMYYAPGNLTKRRL